MLKTKSIKTLGSVIALALFSGAASASLIADTTIFPDGAAFALNSGGEWAAGYFSINNVNVCSNGCDITGAKLLLDLSGGYENTPFPKDNVKLELFSNSGSSSNPVPGQSLFTLTNPTTVTQDLSGGRVGTFVEFTAAAQAQNFPALLQPNSHYWLKLTNVNQSPEFGWYYDGFDSSRADQAWAASGFGNGTGTPMIFQVYGVNSLTSRLAPGSIPIPGAVWMMGSALIGFTITGRRKKTN